MNGARHLNLLDSFRNNYWLKLIKQEQTLIWQYRSCEFYSCVSFLNFINDWLLHYFSPLDEISTAVCRDYSCLMSPNKDKTGRTLPRMLLLYVVWCSSLFVMYVAKLKAKKIVIWLLLLSHKGFKLLLI